MHSERTTNAEVERRKSEIKSCKSLDELHTIVARLRTSMPFDLPVFKPGWTWTATEAKRRDACRQHAITVAVNEKWGALLEEMERSQG